MITAAITSWILNLKICLFLACFKHEMNDVFTFWLDLKLQEETEKGVRGSISNVDAPLLTSLGLYYQQHLLQIQAKPHFVSGIRVFAKW